MSTEKPLWDQFIEWLAGVFSLKSSVEASGETPDKSSNPTPEPVEQKSKSPVESKPVRRIDPRYRGLETQ